MAATVGRVRLQTPSGTCGSRTRTMSQAGSELPHESTIRNETVLPFQGNNMTAMPEMMGSASSPELAETGMEDLRSVVARLEGLQGLQRSLNQPNPELDELIHEVIATRPEWRQRIAVMTKSALLRKKILMCIPQGGRALGSAVLGSSHPWRRRNPDNFTDHNWPKASTGYHGMNYLPGGTTQDHANVLRQPADKIPMNPLLSHSECYSFGKVKRFHGTKEDGTLDKFECQKRGTPGPGSYHKSIPRGPAFSVDGGETFHIGANHICPWKKPLGQHINPIGVDATHLHTAPCYTFPKTRRTVAETSWGHGLQDGGPAKSDSGCLSPGPVYEHFGSMRPKAGTTHGFRSKFAKSRSTGSLLTTRIRMVRVPEEAPPKPEATIMDIKDQAKP